MNKTLSMFGLARRAGKLECGFDAAVDAVKSGRAKGAVAACDISDKTFANLKFHADECGIPAIRTAETVQEISEAIGRKAGVLAICDEGFFKRISELAELNRKDAEVTADGDINE